MEAIILAAGRGTRLLPLTQTTPKPLVLVCGKPLLEHVIDALPKSVTAMHIVVGHLGEQIRMRYGPVINGRKITYIEQGNLNGTGGALMLARDVLKEPTLVVNADDLYAADDLRRLSNFPLAILAKRTTEPVAFPLKVGFFNRWKGFAPASKGGKEVWQNCGAYMLDARYFLHPAASIPVRGGEELSLPHAFAQLAKQENIKIVPATKWLPVGTHQELARANSECSPRLA